jgi:hypothetical protein
MRDKIISNTREQLAKAKLAAETFIEKKAKAIGKDGEVVDSKVIREGTEIFEETLEFMQEHPNEFSGYDSINPEEVEHLVEVDLDLEEEGLGKENIFLALNARNKVIALAD